jgi:hypothetical protein
VNAFKEPDLALRLEKTHSQVASQASRIRRGAWLTLFGGLLVLGLLGAYFYYGYTEFSEFTEPERIAGTVQTLVDDNLPTVRKSVEAEISKSAPVLAQKMSTQLRENIPTGRKKLEDYILDQMKNTLEQGRVQTSDKIASFLRTNRDTLRANTKELAKSSALAESSIATLETALEHEMGADLKGQSMELMAALNSTNDKLQKLAKNTNLNKTEILERRLLQIARRLQMEQVSSSNSVSVVEATAQPVAAVQGTRRLISERGPDPAPKAAESRADSKKASERGSDPAPKAAVPATASKKN